MQEDSEVRPDAPIMELCEQCGATVAPTDDVCANCGTAREPAPPKPGTPL